MSIKGKPFTIVQALPAICLLGMILANSQWSLAITFAQESDDVAAISSSQSAQKDAGSHSVTAFAKSDTEETDSSTTSEASALTNESESQGTLVPAEVDSDVQLEAEPEVGEPAQANNETVELSVEPGAQPLLPADRPAWIGADPDYSGEVHRLYVGSTAVTDPDEVDEALGVPLLAALCNYLDDQVLNSLGAAGGLNLNEAFIRRNLITDPEGVVLKLNTSGEPMYQKWVVMEVTPTQRDLFRQRYREAVQRDRLKPLVASLAALLGLVGLTHLLLRRKHGLPSSQPLVSPNVEAKAENVVKKTKCSSRLWAPLIMLGGIFLLLTLLGAPLMILEKRSVKREFVGEQKNYPLKAVVVDLELGDAIETTSVNNDHQQELIFESNGQQIIQRVQRVR